jgi:hypothetical protein
MTIATVILESDDVSPVRISGVIVRMYSTGGTFVMAVTTDVTGTSVFDVPDADYDLTFYKVGVSPLDGNLQRITVDAGDTDNPPNTYLVRSHITSAPESPDPMLCRVSGYVRGLNGRPSKDLRIAFGMCPDVAVLDGVIIAPQSTFEVAPDANGFFEFDLLRGVKYSAFLSHLETIFEQEPAQLLVIVPDLPALPIKDLLFPVPVFADFDVNAITLNAGDEPDDSIEVVITYSDGSINHDGIRPVPPRFTTVSAVSSDMLVATVVLQVDKIAITPVAPGTTTITIDRVISQKYITYDPVPTFVTESVLVTVV